MSSPSSSSLSLSLLLFEKGEGKEQKRSVRLEKNVLGRFVPFSLEKFQKTDRAAIGFWQ